MNQITPVLLAALMLLAGCHTARTAEPGLAITGVTVIDPVSGALPGRTVLMQGERITAVTTTIDAPPGYHTIDGGGRFLIPGLWDFHVHLTYDEALTAAMPALFLSWGITSVRDTGGLLPKVIPVVAAMRADDAVAPRVWFAGPLLDGRDVVYDGNARPAIGIANADVTSAVRSVHALQQAGASFIKIYELVSEPVFYAMVNAAREAGMPIDSHVPLSMLASVAGPAVDSIEHMRNIELDCADNWRELHAGRLTTLMNPQGIPGHTLRASIHGAQRFEAIRRYDETRCDAVLSLLRRTLQVPTLRLNASALNPAYARRDWDDALRRLPPNVRLRWQTTAGEMARRSEVDTRFARWSLFLAGRMLQANVPLGAGTDTPIGLAIPGYSLHSELEMLVQAGMTPLQAIGAATIVPARYFGEEDNMGTIRPGMLADLVLLDADPTRDIRNTRRIARVVSRGRAYAPEDLLLLTPSSP